MKTAFARKQAVYREVRRAAEAGKVCPSNIDMAAKFGFSTTSRVSEALRTLRDDGEIELNSGPNWRTVTIVAIGCSTKMPTREEMRRRRAKPRPAHVAEGRPKGPIPAPVYRDNCFKCGTRMDVAAPWCTRPHAMECAA